MLKIDKDVFLSNLRLTQKYCQIRLNSDRKDNATILRSINPSIRNKRMFQFEIEHFDFEVEPNVRFCNTTQWAFDPFEKENGDLIECLFEEQLKFKKQSAYAYATQTFEGDIVVSQIDCTVVDGASEVQSLGLVDGYDITPIDTWFYLTKNSESRLLFSWMPKQLYNQTNAGILVNCVDCFGWFQEFYPSDFDITMKI